MSHKTGQKALSEKQEALVYDHLQTGWFDYDYRPKTTAAVLRCFEQIPQELWDDESLTRTLMFAPNPFLLGHAMPFAPNRAGSFISLAPALEKKTQVEVDFTVAHELAHIVLGHNEVGYVAPPIPETYDGTHQDHPTEREADHLAESWVFRKPSARKGGRQ